MSMCTCVVEKRKWRVQWPHAGFVNWIWHVYAVVFFSTQSFVFAYMCDVLCVTTTCMCLYIMYICVNCRHESINAIYSLCVWRWRTAKLLTIQMGFHHTHTKCCNFRLLFIIHMYYTRVLCWFLLCIKMIKEFFFWLLSQRNLYTGYTSNDWNILMTIYL